MVGVHATVFSKGSHQWADRRYMMFEESLNRDQRVHMLGTGTLALHSGIMAKSAWKNMLEYPIENDEILAVKCNKLGIHQYAIQRRASWLVSNPKMKFGIFEETSLDPVKSKRINRILDKGKPWAPLDACRSTAC